MLYKLSSVSDFQCANSVSAADRLQIPVTYQPIIDIQHKAFIHSIGKRKFKAKRQNVKSLGFPVCLIFCSTLCFKRLSKSSRRKQTHWRLYPHGDEQLNEGACTSQVLSTRHHREKPWVENMGDFWLAKYSVSRAQNAMSVWDVQVWGLKSVVTPELVPVWTCG